MLALLGSESQVQASVSMVRSIKNLDAHIIQTGPKGNISAENLNSSCLFSSAAKIFEFYDQFGAICFFSIELSNIVLIF